MKLQCSRVNVINQSCCLFNLKNLKCFITMTIDAKQTVISFKTVSFKPQCLSVVSYSYLLKSQRVFVLIQISFFILN